MESTNEIKGRSVETPEPAPQTEERGITFMDIVRMIFKHWLVLIISIGACAAGGFVYAKVFKKPVWTATGQTYVIVTASDTAAGVGTGEVTTTTLNLSVALLPSVVSFMNSKPVMDATTDNINAELNGHYSSDQIAKMVSASAANYSSTVKSIYIDVKASSSDPDFSCVLVRNLINTSKEMADDATGEYNEVFGNKIKISSIPYKYVDANGKTVYSGVADSSLSTIKVVLIAAAIGLAAGLAYGIIFELLNTHVNTPRELESITGVKVIGNIPDLSPENEKKARRNQRGRRLGGYM